MIKGYTTNTVAMRCHSSSFGEESLVGGEVADDGEDLIEGELSIAGLVDLGETFLELLDVEFLGVGLAFGDLGVDGLGHLEELGLLEEAGLVGVEGIEKLAGVG